MELERAVLLRIYHFMRLTRALEERTRTLFLQGRVVGGVYTAQGHEATTVGAVMTLRDGDCIVPQHRDLGMHLVRGTSPRSIMCQWLARGNSPTLGRDGQLHIGDMHRGIVPMISLLGDSLPVACGVALTMKMRKRPQVVLASCGDGATSTGAFHEAMNFASVQHLPLVLVIENNAYAYSTPNVKQFAVNTLAERAAAYGIPGESIDGNDVLTVVETVGQAIERARAGGGPSIIECKTFRVRGHSEADRASYVPPELREEWLAKDPIKHFETYLTNEDILTPAKKAAIEQQIKAIVDDAVQFAEQSPEPDAAAVAAYVFAPDGPIAIVGEEGARDIHYINALDSRTGQPFNAVASIEEAVGRR
jgi:TPP-dependent pyruvate/acetoin dehydrogenase alpha subunit